MSYWTKHTCKNNNNASKQQHQRNKASNQLFYFSFETLVAWTMTHKILYWKWSAKNTEMFSQGEVASDIKILLKILNGRKYRV